ncbi:lysosomal alpha-mannosidase-like [Zerene cesonia]|uniref:lysosomal alpha-mannosidase-like n=1 Tax=Zerene cesonia TaxID=33412 RepID=UPI0018E53206|nr:lysosomal alpha-mannosidase-like [Zerene cesonia]
MKDLVILINFCTVFALKNKIECGYKQCPQTRDGALNVHIIAHSHMDAGWVKTFDEYYFGTKTAISTANVQLIYHSVLSELLHDKRRKFTFSETAYFWRWWKEQRGGTRSTFKSLVAEGRVQFAGGGWVQSDEATAHYMQLIDQYTWGLRKINDTLGPCGKPKAAWQIDTYGHTKEHTSLLAQMGYDGLFIGRVDHKEREAMIEEDRMEFMWRGSDVLGKMSDIMTHTLYNLYNAPDGFCFDFLCNDEPIVEDTDSIAYNADKRVNDFITQIERQAKYYDHDNIVVMMGGDFTYQSAANWFMNIDKLINHVNTHPANMSDINIFYSTPSCFLKAIYLYGKRDKAIFTEKGDHLPYGSDANTYWTGFYTSRPNIKYLALRAHIYLQVVKQLTVISRMSDSYELHLLRHAVSLVLHHDGITGMLIILTPTWGGSRRPKSSQQFIVCHQLNISQCRFTETQDSMLLLVYNPLSIKTYYHVRLPAVALHYSIRDYNDEEVEYQLLSLPASVINLPGRRSTAIQELCFEAENIPPLGFTAYYITPIRDQLAEGAYVKKSQANTDPEQEVTPSISNEYIKVTVDQKTGLLESIQHLDGLKIMVSQNFYFYSQTQQTLQSGAYSFRPEKNRPIPISEKATFHTIRGSLIKEIRQRYSDWATQVIRLYRGEEFVELEWIIGPVPLGTDLGKEVVSIFKTNISSNGHFYTDSNGRQMIKRSCWNETASHHQKKPVAACYYPVTSRICISSFNSSVDICVLTDRCQGGTSYNDGEIELMLHRRLITDDGFGLEESLNEEAFGVGQVVRGKHRIFFGNSRFDVEDLSFSERVAQTSRKWLYEPWLFLTPGEKINRRKWQNVRNKRYSALRLHGLPRHISIVTLEPWKGGSVLLRLENTLEKHKSLKPEKEMLDDFTNSHITVDLNKIFVHFKIVLVKETTLAANQWLDEARQMDWSTRYVYAGGDDGILPEDHPDYTDDVRQHKPDKEYDDDIDSKRAYAGEKGQLKAKSRYQDYDKRKKRDINITHTDNFYNNTDKTKDEFKHSNNTFTTYVNRFNRKDIFVNKTRNSNRNVFKRFDVTTRRPKLKFLTTQYKKYDLRDDSDENYSNRRRSKAVSYDDTDIYVDADDGVTKSIYEMYYKKNPVRRSYKTYLSSSEEFLERPRKRIKKDGHRNNYRSRSRSRGQSFDMPFFITNRSTKLEDFDDKSDEYKRYKGRGHSNTETMPRREFISLRSAVYNNDGEESQEQEQEYKEESEEARRSRRAINEELPSSEDKSETDYVISLRPTQIRTFVIWFEDKKPYTL